jgi:hypothetical protein
MLPASCHTSAADANTATHLSLVATTGSQPYIETTGLGQSPTLALCVVVLDCCCSFDARYLNLSIAGGHQEHYQ